MLFLGLARAMRVLAGYVSWRVAPQGLSGTVAGAAGTPQPTVPEVVRPLSTNPSLSPLIASAAIPPNPGQRASWPATTPTRMSMRHRFPPTLSYPCVIGTEKPGPERRKLRQGSASENISGGYHLCKRWPAAQWRGIRGLSCLAQPHFCDPAGQRPTGSPLRAYARGMRPS